MDKELDDVVEILRPSLPKDASTRDMIIASKKEILDKRGKLMTLYEQEKKEKQVKAQAKAKAGGAHVAPLPFGLAGGPSVGPAAGGLSDSVAEPTRKWLRVAR